MGDDASRTSNATSAARVAFSEGRPRFDDSETTTPLHEESMELGQPNDSKVKRGNFKLVAFPKQDRNCTNLIPGPSTTQSFTSKLDLKTRVSAYIEASCVTVLHTSIER